MPWGRAFRSETSLSRSGLKKRPQRQTTWWIQSRATRRGRIGVAGRPRAARTPPDDAMDGDAPRGAAGGAETMARGRCRAVATWCRHLPRLGAPRAQADLRCPQMMNCSNAYRQAAQSATLTPRRGCRSNRIGALPHPTHSAAHPVPWSEPVRRPSRPRVPPAAGHQSEYDIASKTPSWVDVMNARDGDEVQIDRRKIS